MTEKNETLTIKASPTKEFFIFMLTRDIPLIRAILDLVDNSVDGATRIKMEDNYSNYWININCKVDYFSIADNCGGIPVKVARDYAFRFGRPKDAELTPGSIGKFGVGMKRAFFKLGNKFSVESNTSVSKFTIEQDVYNWLKDPEDWHFKFKTLKENIDNKPNKIGTIIKITELFDSVSKNFGLENFQNELWEELETAHSVIISKGLVISLNGKPLGKRTVSLLQSDKIQPAYFEKRYDNIGNSPVNVKIYAGISERDFEKGGWYIFCNGRMVLEADQSELTTWGGSNSTPKYHPDFAFFRGYVFFDSDDAELLPWTTTKTGIDSDSNLYKAVKLEMVSLIRPVLDFLRKLANERAQVERGELEHSYLDETFKKTEKTNYNDISRQGHFVTPQQIVVEQKRPRTGRIQYNKPLEEINKVKKILKVTSNKAVGEETFDYFMEMELEK